MILNDLGVILIALDYSYLRKFISTYQPKVIRQSAFKITSHTLTTILKAKIYLQCQNRRAQCWDTLSDLAMLMVALYYFCINKNLSWYINKLHVKLLCILSKHFSKTYFYLQCKNKVTLGDLAVISIALDCFYLKEFILIYRPTVIKQSAFKIIHILSQHFPNSYFYIECQKCCDALSDLAMLLIALDCPYHT